MSDVLERRIAGLTVLIDRAVCIGSNNCVRLAPEVFELDPQRIVTFRPEIGPIDRERLVEACRVCPVDALTAVGESGENLAP